MPGMVFAVCKSSVKYAELCIQTRHGRSCWWIGLCLLSLQSTFILRNQCILWNDVFFIAGAFLCYLCVCHSTANHPWILCGFISSCWRSIQEFMLLSYKESRKDASESSRVHKVFINYPGVLLSHHFFCSHFQRKADSSARTPKLFWSFRFLWWLILERCLLRHFFKIIIIFRYVRVGFPARFQK